MNSLFSITAVKYYEKEPCDRCGKKVKYMWKLWLKDTEAKICQTCGHTLHSIIDITTQVSPRSYYHRND